MNGLLSEFVVLRTRTAFRLGDVVIALQATVAGTVTLVTSGAEVGARQSKSLQGHPAKQFSLTSLSTRIKNKKKYLAGAVKLSSFETGQTIIFALLIIFAFVNTSPKGQTVFVYTSVPVLIFFDIVIVQMS